ncbi:hypothetical protein EST38_g9735 [Candolleomyces aberdarensis]|uniref:Cytochrome P450 n=1 Tax=Candolleomyces aberdarensis TaxID=2316362 RepID=A0A4Q2DAW3_9AGAR|nr:hypothetical protein EST38_g9735 [Candolleomyces aberdarensis]
MLTLVIIAVTVLSLLLCAMDVLRNTSIAHSTLDSIRSCLSPPGATTGQLLTERSMANMRLVKAFNLSNTFVSNNTSTHSTFVTQAHALLKRSNRLGWLHFRDLSMQAVRVELSELNSRTQIPYDVFIQCATLRVILIGLLGVDASVESFAREDVVKVTSHINRLWALSKKPESIPLHLLPQLNDALRRLIPDTQAYPNPVDFVIPAWETLWRVVAIAVAYSHQDEGMLDAFLSLYRTPSVKTFAGHGARLSPKNIVDETMRLHPPSKRIGRMKTRPFCQYLPSTILELLQRIIPNRITQKESADVAKIQQCADIWGSGAGQFDPSRFLCSAEPTKEQFDTLKYVFGGGPFRCIGASWAPVAVGVICSAVLTTIDGRDDLRIVQGAEIGGRDGWNEWYIERV